MMISASNQPLYISTREMKRDWIKYSEAAGIKGATPGSWDGYHKKKRKSCPLPQLRLDAKGNRRESQDNRQIEAPLFFLFYNR